jgi:hypothetical protein
MSYQHKMIDHRITLKRPLAFPFKKTNTKC